MLQSAAVRRELVIVLTTILALVSLIALCTTVALVWSVLRGTPIHFLLPLGHGESQPGVLSDGFILKYAEQVARERYTWTFATAPQAQALFKERLAPRFLTDYEQRVLPAENQAIKAHKISSQLAVLTSTILERQDWKRRIQITAIRHLWMGGTAIDEDIQIEVLLGPRYDTEVVGTTTVKMLTGFWVYQMLDNVPLPKTGGRS